MKYAFKVEGLVLGIEEQLNFRLDSIELQGEMPDEGYISLVSTLGTLFNDLLVEANKNEIRKGQL